MIDDADRHSVERAVASIPPIDALVMNAGGRGAKQPVGITPDGVTNIFAVNRPASRCCRGLIEEQKLHNVPY